jgi:protein SCO1/2
MHPRRTLAALACAALLTGCVTGCGAGTASTASGPSASPAAWHGVEPEPVPDRPDFVLRTTSGERYDFGERTGGKPTLLYFGYTNCPDECPTAMADISAALRSTPTDLREDVQVVFVTTDPARDTPQVLREWLDQFSQEYVGLVGTQAEVDAAQESLGLQAAKKGGDVPTLPGKPNEHAHKPGTAPHKHTRPLGYGVGHANVIFGISTSDKLPVLYPGGVRPSDIAADLPLLAQTQGDAP